MSTIYRKSSAIGVIHAPVKERLIKTEITTYRDYLCFRTNSNADGIIGTPFAGNGMWVVELEHVRISPKSIKLLEKLRIPKPLYAKINIWVNDDKAYISWLSTSNITVIKPSLVRGRSQYNTTILKQYDGLRIPYDAVNMVDLLKPLKTT